MDNINNLMKWNKDRESDDSSEENSYSTVTYCTKYNMRDLTEEKTNKQNNN